MSTGFIDASVFYPDMPEGASVPEQIGILCDAMMKLGERADLPPLLARTGKSDRRMCEGDRRGSFGGGEGRCALRAAVERDSLGGDNPGRLFRDLRRALLRVCGQVQKKRCMRAEDGRGRRSVLAHGDVKEAKQWEFFRIPYRATESAASCRRNSADTATVPRRATALYST